jgi:hypothetical protein
MFVKLFAIPVLALGLLFAGVAADDSKAPKPAPKKAQDCCALELTCCEDGGSACCEADKKIGCCEKGLKCCADDRACCDAKSAKDVKACCVEGKKCCAESKDCCGPKDKQDKK